MIRLNRRLVLEAPQRVPDGAGGFTTGWQALGTLWAEIRPGAGREAGGGGVALSRQVLRVTLRAAAPGATSRPGPGQRFREGDRLFVILTASDSADGRWCVCTAQEEIVP